MRCPWCGAPSAGKPARDRPTAHRCTRCDGLFHAYPGGAVVYSCSTPSPDKDHQ